MYLKLRQSAFAAVAISVLTTSAANADDQASKKEPGKKANPAVDQAAMMKLWTKIATPGDAHKVLSPLEGKWTTTTRMWMAGPDGPASASKGTAEYKWVLGGRFLMQEVKGTMLGRPFNGIGFLGYDNFKKKYVSSWMDSVGTAMYTSEGLADRTKKSISFYGKMDEFLTGEHDKPVKYVLRIVGKDKLVYEIHDLVLGKKSKVVEITYERKKK